MSKSDLSFPITPNSDELVSIIIVHRDKPAYLNIALQSIAVTSLNSNYEIIIVDNGSETQDAKDFLDDLEKQDCKIIRNPQNQWWSKAANQGAKAASKESKYLIFLHHDVVIQSPAWIDMLINVSESQNSGLVGVSMSAYEIDEANGKKTNVDFVEEWCLLTTKECWQDCGPFNEKLEQLGAPFIYTMTAQWSGYEPQVIRNPLVWHYGVFNMSVSDLEVFRDQARALMPGILREAQLKLTKE
jgi:glycosyltransferase involved in cell wall biosynthesis